MPIYLKFNPLLDTTIISYYHEKLWQIIHEKHKQNLCVEQKNYSPFSLLAQEPIIARGPTAKQMVHNANIP